jgi:tRNA(Ser,Leu) C12 N-acetylase TAN1
VVRNSVKKHSQPGAYLESEEERVERMMRFHRIVKAKYNDISKTVNSADEHYKVQSSTLTLSIVCSRKGQQFRDRQALSRRPQRRLVGDLMYEDTLQFQMGAAF